MASRRSKGIGDIVVNVETLHVKAAVRALMAEADGKALRNELARNLRVALIPVRDKARANIRSMPVKGSMPYSGADVLMPLRQAIANQTKVTARLAGRVPVVALRADKTNMPRGFSNAPRAFNEPSFRHPVYGDREVWRPQTGRPRWFDDPALSGSPEYTAAVVKAVYAVSSRVAARTQSGA